MKDTPSIGALTERHALVTGGGRGIGRAVAERLSTMGAVVSISGRKQPALNQTHEEMGLRGGVYRTDVTRREAVREMLAQCSEQFGAPALLINNAGASESAPFSKTDERLWQQMIEVNLNSVYFCSQELLERWPSSLLRHRSPSMRFVPVSPRPGCCSKVLIQFASIPGWTKIRREVHCGALIRRGVWSARKRSPMPWPGCVLTAVRRLLVNPSPLPAGRSCRDEQ